MRRRIACASTGAAPSVEMPITTGPRLTMVPKVKSQCAGWSMTLTITPASCAAARNAAAASPSSAPTATALPAKSASRHGRRSIVIALPCAAATAIISTEISSARTSTRAPQAARSSAFQAAAASPPATSASRPLSSRKTGSRASGPIRAGRRSAGFGESRNGIDMVRLVLGLAQGGLRDDPPDLGAA